MAIDETRPARGQMCKPNALCKLVGDDLVEQVFGGWLVCTRAVGPKVKPDPVAGKIAAVPDGLLQGYGLRFGNYDSTAGSHDRWLGAYFLRYASESEIRNSSKLRCSFRLEHNVLEQDEAEAYPKIIGAQK